MKHLFSVLLFSLAILSCSGGKDSPAPAPVVTTLTLNNSNLVLVAHQSIQLMASVVPYSTVTWTSSDSTVAQVSAAGMVTAISKGEADITATARETTAVCKVVVPSGSIEYSWLVVGQDQGRAMVWTDKNTYDLGKGIAKSVAKNDDGTLFVVGESDEYPAIWIGDNFTKQQVSSAKGRINCIFPKDNDIYIAGQINGNAIYWDKNIGKQNNTLPVSQSHTLLNSEINAMIVESDNKIMVVGSGEFSRYSNIAINKTQIGFDWTTGDLNILTGAGVSPDMTPLPFRSYNISYDMVRLVNDGSVIRVGTIYRLDKEFYGEERICGEILSRRGNGGGPGNDFYDGTDKEIYAYDAIPYSTFNTGISKNNIVLIATSNGLYKASTFPNKAYVEVNSFTDFGINKMPGYGYSRAVRVLGSSIYAAGKNILWKDGLILKEFSSTGEAYSMLVQ